MAPLSSGAEVMPNFQHESRSLSSNSTGSTPRISDFEGYQLQILALTFSAVSVASAVLAFYWFIKMRRTFRHDLIMLLIQSDMFKALWFMVYPIVTFTHGPVLSTSSFCQVNGFFLAVGIEASDFAILMIAVHSALYIFRPRSGGEGGLYPYRNTAYACWIIFPLLMASLAFINDQNAYVSEGTYCYLPIRPFWYRLALSWIPRYLIFVVILIIYASIYFYVRYKFRGFKKMRTSSDPGDTSPEAEVRQFRPVKRNTIPPTPTLNAHGLIPESGQTPSIKEGRRSLSRPANGRNLSLGIGAHRFMWASFSAPAGTPSPQSERSIEDADSFDGPSTPHPLSAPAMSSPSSTAPILAAVPPAVVDSRNTSWGGAFVRRFSPYPRIANDSEKPSTVGMLTILQHHPDDSETSTPLSQLRLVNSRGQNFADAEMVRTRDKVRRQLRFLFIYPLVYIGMWVIPFVSHAMSYNDKFASNPPFTLTCITTICVACQAAIDCWLFSTREKPWRHIHGNDGTFWGSLKFWSGWREVSQRRAAQYGGPGKTRQEMDREARAAYLRRDEEAAARRVGSFGPQNGEAARKKGERSWWENLGSMDGAMSPVEEEMPNPMNLEAGPDMSKREGDINLDGPVSPGSETMAELEKFVFEKQIDGKGT